MAPPSLYSKLAATGKAFVESTSPKVAGGNSIDYDAIRATVSPDFRMTWGPKAFVATKPELQETRDTEGFLKHMDDLAPVLKTWKVEVYDVTADVEKRVTTVRAYFHMTVKAGGGHEAATVICDIVFFLKADASGDKVEEGCEYLDAEANFQIHKHVAMAKHKVEGNY